MEPLSLISSGMAVLSGLGGVLFFYVKSFNKKIEQLEKDKACKHEVRELISLNLKPIAIELKEIKEDLQEIKQDVKRLKK
jgi:Tfp pilus assembly protein PilO